MSYQNETRILRNRLAALSAAQDRASAGATEFKSARIALQVYDGGDIPNQGDRIFLGHPVDFDGAECEGCSYAPSVDTSTSVPFVALDGPFSAGDLTIATAVGGRWVAEKGGSKPKCRWLCGPTISIAAPGDPSCDTAQASLTVGPDGKIASVKLLYGGACYVVAHPTVTISGGGGAGATAQATVGEVTGLTLTDPGAGYVVAPAVSIATPGVGGTQATATATIDPVSGAVTGLTLASGGSLYRVANPVVTIDPPPPGPGARQARGTARAQPGVVTSLKLTGPGAGYISNAVPSKLNFTISCPAWSFSLTLNPGAMNFGPTYPDIDDKNATLPPGAQPYCYFSGRKVVNIPGSAVCGTIAGVTMAVLVLNTVSRGWVVAVDFTVQKDAASTFPCPAEGGALGPMNCLKLSATYPAPSTYFNVHGPFGPTGISCPSRPFAYAATSQLRAEFGGTPIGEPGWYVLAGGNCPVQDPAFPGPQPTIPLTFSLSEP